jgi:NAD(P)-dependent dehydrogenase (short-subunit alcohol dehydrogenase family)
MSSQAVALIVGAGPNVGQHVARALASKGYKDALASRSTKNDDIGSNLFNFQIDLANPSSIPELFSKVKEALGTPSVVVYNG